MATLSQHKIPAGTVPWFAQYYSMLDDIENILTVIETNIGTNDTDINTLNTSIDTNTSRTTTNRLDIASLNTSVTTNTNAIATNTASIVTNNTWQDDIDAKSAFGVPAKDWLLLVENFLVDSYTYTYTEKVSGFRSRTLGVHTSGSLSMRLDVIEHKIDFVMDYLKSIGANYMDDSGNVVPPTTPNP